MARINSLSLAYTTFLNCRHAGSQTQSLLTLLLLALGRVKEEETLVVEVSDSHLELLSSDFKSWFVCDPDCEERKLASLLSEHQWLLSFLHLATIELNGLWEKGMIGAVRSLGYAIHFMPNLIQSGKPFEPDSFDFCFRIMVTHWESLSAEMCQALIEVAGVDPDLVPELIAEEGFAIDMFRSSGG